MLPSSHFSPVSVMPLPHTGITPPELSSPLLPESVSVVALVSAVVSVVVVPGPSVVAPLTVTTASVVGVPSVVGSGPPVVVTTADVVDPLLPPTSLLPSTPSVSAALPCGLKHATHNRLTRPRRSTIMRRRV
jgi:hypothetical protein